MTKYQLAKLIAMAGKIQSRKRIQKTVHLLQVAGCPLQADYRLHYYGPYSGEVAGMLDQMTASQLLVEEEQPLAAGRQYNYSLAEHASQSMERFEQGERGREALQQIAQFEDLLKDLCHEPPKTLEYASTIAYFVEAGRNWDDAREETAKYKDIELDSSTLDRAVELARRVVRQADGDN